jgi:DNA-binding NarL/FixJ family response regulator
VRVLVVDDNEAFLRAAADLAVSAGFDVVGHARCGDDACRLNAELEPDLVLLDVNMPGTSGYEIAARIHRTHPDARVVLISANPPEVAPPDAPPVLPKQTLSPELLRAFVGAVAPR